MLYKVQLIDIIAPSTSILHGLIQNAQIVQKCDFLTLFDQGSSELMIKN